MVSSSERAAQAQRRFDALCRQLIAESPRFRLAYKDESAAQRQLARLIAPFNRRYLQDYTTVLSGVVWFPSRAWCDAVGPEALFEILSHEAVHLRDARRFPLLFELSYLLLPLPTLLTARAFWEWRGYAASMRARVELGLPVDDAWIEHVVRRFVGPDYLFMLPWPGLVRGQLRRLRARLEGEEAPP